MTQVNEIKLQKGIDYELLKAAMEDKKLTYDDLEARTNVSKDTIKNILTGKTKNPGVESLNPICIELGISIQKVLRQDEKSAMEAQGIQDGNAAILALKEIYEAQLSAQKATSEAHIANIRAHYEQHHEDLVDNFEKRLSDKREIIDILKEENAQLNAKLQEQENFYNAKLQAQAKETLIGNWIRNIIIALFVIGTIVLLVLEFIHPTHGWIRW